MDTITLLYSLLAILYFIVGILASVLFNSNKKDNFAAFSIVVWWPLLLIKFLAKSLWKTLTIW